jgi:D-alanyl-D-alanine carboxypeptidase/D-alanyl-D-alanine-endopeptidase (penicillin-binding protein 4)
MRNPEPGTRLRGAALFVSLALAAGAICAQPLPDLATRVETSMSDPSLTHALWGVLLEDDTGRTLYSRNAVVLMIPASNRKLFTAALVADCDPLDAQIPTELWVDGSIDAGAVHGNLVVRGNGDPSLAGRFYEDKDLPFAPFLKALRDRNVQRVEGDIVADVSAFDRVTLPGSWKWGNLGADFAAPVDALAWNEDLVGIDITLPHCGATPSIDTHPPFLYATASIECAAEGSPEIRADDRNRVIADGAFGLEHKGTYGDLISVSDPGLYTAQALRDFLLRNGVDVSGTVRVVTVAHPWTEQIAVHQSPMLYLVLSRLLKNSQNLYAEMLLKRTAIGGGGSASFRRAQQLQRIFLTETVGIDGSEFSFADGSGLSADDLVTPNAVVKLLRYLDEPARREAFWSMLAAPAEDGTLKKRLTELSTRLRGKTGTISGVSALSGIIRGRSGGVRYFSVIVNHSPADPSKAIDAVVREFADF